MGDSEFLEKLLSSFRLEAEDHLKVLNDGFLRLEKGEQGEVVQTLFRAAHSLKGAARSVNLITVESVCQSLESLLASIRDDGIEADADIVNKLYQYVDDIEKQIFSEPSNAVEEESPVKQKSDSQSIRIGTVKINRLLQHVEEMLMIKLTSQQQLKDMKNLQILLLRWSKEILNIDPDKLLVQLFRSRNEVSDQHREVLLNISNQLSVYFENQKDFIKNFRDQLNHLTRISEQDHRVISGMIDSVLDDTKEILMQPISTILEGFPRMVRDLAKSLEKEVNYSSIGDDVEIDRRILERIRDPLTHLIRNSIDHGIETPHERGGKPSQGFIKIETTQVRGNKVVITVSDDGRGIDIAKVKEVALRDGIVTKTELEKMSNEEVMGLIYYVGFSTSPIVTDISGRGVGLNVVAENVEKLGGKVSIDSKVNEGTTIKFELPLTLSTFRGIHVRVSDQEFIIPTHNVQRVIRVQPIHIKTVENRQTISLDGRTLPFLQLADVLGVFVPEESEQERLYITTLVIRAADTTVALGVDQILNEQEIFVKSLGKQLHKVKNISAATVMEWGKVLPVLDPFDLIKSITMKTSVRKKAPVQKEIQEPEQKSILIAEDSVTSRMLLKNILESAGFKVKSAVDGIEAYSILSTEEIDLLLSDVEMPRMTGFELTEKVRGNEKFKDLPVVLCTSRGSKEDREHGISVGADAYIDKSSFIQSNLLEIIEQLL